MARNFKVQYNPQIYLDIQKFVDHYRKETGNNQLGTRFIKTVKTTLKKLNKSALHYQVRYDDIRFLPIPVFSVMVHYRVDEENNTVSVEAIFHTKDDPEKWTGR
ncbi:MAG: type II toxin-antitoxin system RelE/ParE family toxin [Reichenbachiella sp.]|uniref:type II toxin-antitoxin system RelE/ParE family toxin n=1 Tax=Reichenbachiella sp. TaxID=2184521 RepID=UPI002966C60E|nr:type II toxin-antitoxin system RelE/ParE family toxin [Reichenbachiella sp.]MDW3211658.1 type II toxin-antitoxin system RelE/ParE family toxin [Reichenbachiella sp.]